MATGMFSKVASVLAPFVEPVQHYLATYVVVFAAKVVDAKFSYFDLLLEIRPP